MAGSYTPTGTYSNLTRLELEELRRGDYTAGGKALTIGDSGLAPEGVVGPGNVNAEPFATKPALAITENYALVPPGAPGPELEITSRLDQTTVGDNLRATTVRWYGPQLLAVGGTTVGAATAIDTFTNGQDNVANGVLVGDLLLVQGATGVHTDNNQYAVGTVSVVAVGSVTVAALNAPHAAVPTQFDINGDNFNAIFVRPGVVQLFAVPGSGPLGQEQTFLFVKPGSTLHSNTGPTTDLINADRVQNIVSPKYASSTDVDRADAVYASPAPRSGLDSLGYRVALYPDDGTGTAPDLTAPIASLNPVIDPAIPAGDQRMTFDYAAGVLRFSCAPAIGGQIKVTGGVNATTGRLNLYAVFWAVDTSSSWGLREITVGDGVTSFGDFNGVDAVKQAITYWQTNQPNLNSLRIYVKRGNYTIPSTTSITAGQELILRGDGRQATKIALTYGGGSFIVHTGAQLTLEDLTMMKTSASTPRIQGSLRAKRVLFQTLGWSIQANVPFQAAAEGPFSPIMLMEDCEFDGESWNIPLIQVIGGSGTYDGLIFKDCRIRGAATGDPIVDVTASGSSWTLSNILFERCKIEVHAIASTSTTQISGPSGLIYIDPNGTTDTTTINKVSFIDCDVTALDDAVGNTVLLHLMPIAFDAADTTVRVSIGTVRISGGTWSVPSTRGSDFVPFFLQCNKPIVRDVAFISSGQLFVTGVSGYGVAPGYRGNGTYTDPQKIALRGAAVNVGVSQGFATIAASGSALEAITLPKRESGLVVRDILFQNFNDGGGQTGALVLYGPNIKSGPAHVDGVTVQNISAGADLTANTAVASWVVLVPGGVGSTNRGSTGYFRNIVFSNAGPASINDTGPTKAYIAIQAEGNLVLEDAYIDPGINGSGDPASLDGVGTNAGPIYVGEDIWTWAGTATDASGPISIVRPTILNCIFGINSKSSNHVNRWGSLSVTGLVWDATQGPNWALGPAIAFTGNSTHASGGLRLEDCRISARNLPTGSAFIGIDAGAFWDQQGAGAIRDNKIFLDAGSHAVSATLCHGIRILSANAGSFPTFDIVGNACVIIQSSAAQTFWKIKLQQANGAALVANTTWGQAGYMNCETGQGSSVHTHEYLSGNPMLCNYASLISP